MVISYSASLSVVVVTFTHANMSFSIIANRVKVLLLSSHRELLLSLNCILV